MAIRFCSLSSGSSGNCIYLETERTRILIDAGFSGKQVEVLLKEIGVDPSTLDLILVTHEHTDHIKGVGILSRRFQIPIVTNYETWLAMENTIGKIKDENLLFFKTDQDFTVRDLDIHPMSTFHDSARSVGYIFYHNRKKISLLTDTGFVNDVMKKKMAGSDLYFFEANHDIATLKAGTYPYRLKQRILSTKGHLSNLDAAIILSDLLSGKQETIQLAHLSQENNTPQMAFQTIYGHLQSVGLDPNRDMCLEVANRYKPSKIVELK